MLQAHLNLVIAESTGPPQAAKRLCSMGHTAPAAEALSGHALVALQRPNQVWRNLPDQTLNSDPLALKSHFVLDSWAVDGASIRLQIVVNQDLGALHIGCKDMRQGFMARIRLWRLRVCATPRCFHHHSIEFGPLYAV